MKPFRKELIGILSEVEEKKIKLYMLDKSADNDTHYFLNTYYKDIIHPVKYPTFNVKLNSKSKAFSDEKKINEVVLSDLIGKVVRMETIIKHYYFKKNGKTIKGWNINLENIYSIE